MHFLFPPFRTRAHFCRNAHPPADGFPIPWAIRAESLRAGRVLLACLRCGREVQSGEVVVAGDGRVYVRWWD
jgi:hypothetical protein